MYRQTHLKGRPLWALLHIRERVKQSLIRPWLQPFCQGAVRVVLRAEVVHLAQNRLGQRFVAWGKSGKSGRGLQGLPESFELLDLLMAFAPEQRLPRTWTVASVA